jgi:HEAT repeat protein
MWKNYRNLVLALALLAAAAASSAAQEAKLIAVLRSGATQEEKATACRELARVATKQSVPALAALLGDEKLSHMARYALETIPDPSVDEALRGALGKLSGRPLQGVIGSLGVRRDGLAVAGLAKLLSTSDAEVARAAAHALGNIGTAEAAKALDLTLDGASGARQAAVCEGLLRAAEALAARGQGDSSRAIYDRLFGLASASPAVRAAALRGAILARGIGGIPLLIEALGGADRALTAAAVRAAMELPGPEVTAALCAELPKLPALKQMLLVNTLGYRGDASAGPALLAAASQGPAAVRQAAVENLTHLGYAPAVPLLVQLSLSGETDLAAAARSCLGSFPGRDADAAILAMFAQKDAKVRSLAVAMIAERGGVGANPALLKAAGDADESVRLAALKALYHQAGVADLPALLNILVNARSAAMSQAAEEAISALCARESRPAAGKVIIIKAEYGALPKGPLADVTKKVAALVKAGAMAIDASNENFGDPAQRHVKRLRIDYCVNGVKSSKTVPEQGTVTFTATATPPAVVDAICTAMPMARGEAKLALLRTLRLAGGAKALQAVEAAAGDDNPQVKDAALLVLCDWPTPDALPMIAGLAKRPPSATIKILALRALVRLVPLEDAPDAKKGDALKAAMALADRDEEKRLIFSALGSVATDDALALTASYLDKPALKEEACLAAVAIAEKLPHAHAAQVAAAMRKVAKATGDKKLAARANAIAAAAMKK